MKRICTINLVYIYYFLFGKDMLIYIRHSDDQTSDTTHEHDPKLNQEGKNRAAKEGRSLIKEFGIPTIIYCSPYRRTRETVKYMLRNVSRRDKAGIRIVFNSRLARYFAKVERRNVNICDSTRDSDIPIYESRKEFIERVEKLAKRMEHYIDSDEIVWCITHTTVYKRLGRIYDIPLPSYIPHMDNFVTPKLRDVPAEPQRTSNKKKKCEHCGQIHG